VRRALFQLKQIARFADRNGIAFTQCMYRKGSALRAPFFQDAQLIVLPVLRIAAKGVRADQFGAEMQVDMSPRAKRRQCDALRMRQGQQHHVALHFASDNL
jgi:hypothetical protein